MDFAEAEIKQAVLHLTFGFEHRCAMIPAQLVAAPSGHPSRRRFAQACCSSDA